MTWSSQTRRAAPAQCGT